MEARRQSWLRPPDGGILFGSGPGRRPTKLSGGGRGLLSRTIDKRTRRPLQRLVGLVTGLPG